MSSSKRSKRKSTDILQSNPSEGGEDHTKAGSMAEMCAVKEAGVSMKLKEKKGSMGSMAEMCAVKEAGVSMKVKDKKKGSMAEMCADKEAGVSSNVKVKKMNLLDKDNKVDVLKFLEDSYNITPPLKVLLHRTSFQYMQIHSLTKESISELFASHDVSFYVTRHTADELNALGEGLSAVREATVCLKARCVNDLLCSDEDECILSLVKNDNEDKYIVVTSDDALYAKLTQLSVPLVRCYGGAFVFDWASEEQRDELRAGVPEIKELNVKGSRARNSPRIKNRQNKKSRRVESRNTIGDVPIDWYRFETHAGYDKDGRKIMRKDSPDMIDRFLASRDDPKSWCKSITDDIEGEDVELTKEELKIVKNVSQGKAL